MYFTESLIWEICIIGLSITTFTLVNILTKPYKHHTDLILSLWLLLLNIPLLHTLLTQLNVDSPTFSLYTNPTLNLLHGPLLYLYVRELINNKKRVMKRSELLHLVPFALLYLLFINMSHPKPMIPSPDESNIPAGPVSGGGIPSLFEPFMVNFGFINGLLFIAYSLATIYTLMKHQTNIAEIFSRNDNPISLKWLYTLPATFAVLVVLNFANENILDSTSVIYPLTFHMMSFLSFIILLCFFGVKQKPVFLTRRPITNRVKVTEEKNTPENSLEDFEENHSELSEAAITQLIQDMKNYMTNEKPYLDPNFSVYTLADAVNTPRRLLSHVLNGVLSKNFYQYVNEFRISEVKHLLESPDEAQSTILDIAFRCGFKSKSSFNSLFKQYCEMTPSQYRKKVLQQAHY